MWVSFPIEVQTTEAHPHELIPCTISEIAIFSDQLTLGLLNVFKFLNFVLENIHQLTKDVFRQETFFTLIFPIQRVKLLQEYFAVSRPDDAQKFIIAENIAS